MLLMKRDYFKKLYRIKDNPYFASIIFEDEDGERFNVYLGLTYLKDDDYGNIIYDWRSPICSLFYDFEVGKCAYAAPGGAITGELLRKRQYKIEKCKLISAFDNSISIDDELLQEVLATDSNDKMKNIVNTIQQEQNNVIRNVRDKTLIVSGIAGSGKTSVALHRIAFLLYKIKNLTSNDILIFSPNQIFTEYISNVLPELGEDNTLQTTFNDYLSKTITEFSSVEPFMEFIGKYYTDREKNIDLIKYKQSDGIIEDIERYYNHYEINLYKNKQDPTDFVCNEILDKTWYYASHKNVTFEKLNRNQKLIVNSLLYYPSCIGAYGNIEINNSTITKQQE
jgi:DNA helicase-2/ATP-dependent DNA helicase PcrA